MEGIESLLWDAIRELQELDLEMNAREQSTSNVDAVDTGITETVDFPSELQDETLQKFLKDLNLENITWAKHNLLKSWWISLRKYRGVSKLWKEQSDKWMEIVMLAVTRRWQPNLQWKDIFPVPIKHAVLSPMANMTSYPTFESVYDGSNPFEGKLLCGIGNSSDDPHPEASRLANDLIIRFASHISILGLTSIKIELKVFTSILGATHNCKVLVLNKIKVLVEGMTELCTHQMPKLAQLDTLMLLDFVLLVNKKFEKNGQNVDGNPLQHVWLFKNYNDRLVRMQKSCLSSINIGILPNMEQLSILTPDLSWLQPIGPGVSLKKLGVSMLRSKETHIVWDVANLFEYLDRYASKLDEVYLDISWNNFICGKPRNGNKRLKLFPFVRKVTFGDPQSEEQDSMLVSQILIRFPAIEELVLLSNNQTFIPSPVYYLDNEYEFGAPPRFNSYWGECPDLKKITLVMRSQLPSTPDLRYMFKRQCNEKFRKRVQEQQQRQ